MILTAVNQYLMQKIIENIRAKEWLVAAGHFDFFGRGSAKLTQTLGKFALFTNLELGGRTF